MLPLLASLIGTIFAVLWLAFPGLSSWGLQAAAALGLLYLATLWITGKRLGRFLPSRSGIESSFLTAAAGILVGSSGGTASPFFLVLPFTVLFCTLTLPVSAVILQTAGLSLILWMSHSPTQNLNEVLTPLLVLPGLLPLALLARAEMEETKNSQHAQWIASKQREKQNKDALLFLSTRALPVIRDTAEALDGQRQPELRQGLLDLKTEIHQYVDEVGNSQKPSEDISPKRSPRNLLASVQAEEHGES